MAVLCGVGLHSGRRTLLRLCPAPFGSGILFVRTDLPGHPSAPAHSFDHDAPPFRTVIKAGAAEIHTVEHLLSALAGLGITDCCVEVDGLEVPGMDGSARDFATAILEAGMRDDETASIEAVEVRTPIALSEGIAHLEAHPWEGLKVSYTLDYPGNPLAQGTYEFELSTDKYLEEIAPARTFAIRKDAEIMRAAGLGKGADYQNTVVIDGARALETTLRFENEPVRHKILDLIGDLYVLGRPVNAHVIARCSGHRINRALAMRLVNGPTA